MFQRVSFHQFHRDEGLAVCFFNVVNRADVRMVERRGGTRFSSEPLEGLAVFRKFLRQEFQRHEAAQLSVFSLVNDTHTAATKLLHDAIVGDGYPDQAIHKWGNGMLASRRGQSRV